MGPMECAAFCVGYPYFGLQYGYLILGHYWFMFISYLTDYPLSIIALTVSVVTLMDDTDKPTLRKFVFYLLLSLSFEVD